MGSNILGNRSRSDATADLDDVLIPLGILRIVDLKVLTHVRYRIGPRSAPWKFGYDPANTIGGWKRGDIHSSSLETWFP